MSEDVMLDSMHEIYLPGYFRRFSARSEGSRASADFGEVSQYPRCPSIVGRT
jgi:hypothetical protein